MVIFMMDKPSRIINSYNPSRIGNQKLSRYGMSDVVTDEAGNSYLVSQSRKYIKESTKDTLYTVEPECENRLDAVSYKFYNTPHLWWAIATMNHIKNPMRLEVGIVLRIPPLEHIVV